MLQLKPQFASADTVRNFIAKNPIPPYTIDIFNNAATAIKPLTTKLDQDTQMILYGLYKQTLNGNVQGTQPSFIFSMLEYYKWGAWKKYESLSKEDALKAYVHFASVITGQDFSTSISQQKPKAQSIKLDEAFSSVEDLSAMLSTMSIDAVSPGEINSATEQIKRLENSIDDETQLLLYALLQQSQGGMVGKCPPEDSMEYEQYQAWKRFEALPPADAARAFVYLANQIVADTAAVSSSSSQQPSWVVMSTLMNQDDDKEEVAWGSHEELFAAVVSNDINKVKDLLSAGKCDVNAYDANGMTALHYCCDRGHGEICEVLLSHNAHVNAITHDDQHYTPLMFAVICDQIPIIQILIKHPQIDLSSEELQQMIAEDASIAAQEIFNEILKSKK